MKLTHVYGFLLLLGLGLMLNGCGGGDIIPPDVPDGPEWQLLVQDSDEGLPANLDSLLVLVTDTSLVFRCVTHSNWADPHDPDGGVNAAIFLDLDTDPTTGLSELSGYPYRPNDIGADRAILIGVEGDAVFSWNSGDVNWDIPLEPTSLLLDADTNWFEVEVSFTLIGNPDMLHIVAASVSWVDDQPRYDFAPDSGHVPLVLQPDVAFYGSLIDPQAARNLYTPPVSAWRR